MVGAGLLIVSLRVELGGVSYSRPRDAEAGPSRRSRCGEPRPYHLLVDGPVSEDAIVFRDCIGFATGDEGRRSHDVLS